MSGESDSIKPSVPTPDPRAAVADAANTPAKKRVVISITVKRSEPTKEQRRVNRAQVGLAVLAFVGGLCFWLNDLVVASGNAVINWNVPLALSVALVVVIDAFLALLLRTVIYRGSTGEEPFPKIPDRGPAAVLLALLYFALIGYFAHLNLATGITKADNAYEAFLTVATLEHSHYNVENQPWLQGLVAFEILSVVLLFFVFFPLLVGRLAVFKGEVTTMDDLRRFNHPKEDIQPRAAFTLTANDTVQWILVQGTGGGAPLAAAGAVVNVDEWGKVTIKESKSERVVGS